MPSFGVIWKLNLFVEFEARVSVVARQRMAAHPLWEPLAREVQRSICSAAISLKEFLMRNILIVAVTALISFEANASWFQHYCSSADATVRTAGGHNENFTRLTERTWGPNGPVDKIVEIEGLETTVVNESEISDETRTTCKPGDPSGVVEWKTISFQKVQFKKADGSALPGNLVGRTQDGLAVEANVLCEVNGNSRTVCQ